MPGPIVAEVLRRLEKVRKSGKGWSALCPAHEDRDPSLSVAEGADGRALLTCHRNCRLEDIAAALGMAVVDLFPARADEMKYQPPRGNRNGATVPKVEPEPSDLPPAREWPVVHRYDYVDASGMTVFQVERKEPAVQLAGKKRKTFVQRRPDNGTWAYNLDGIGVRPLYRLPELLEDLAHERTILLVEGEKDADTARSLGIAATAHAGGANGWRHEYAEQLKDADVVIIPDTDDQGREWAVEAGESLVMHGARVRMFAVPLREEGADLTDWVQSGATTEQITHAITRARPWAIGNPAPAPRHPSRFDVYSDVRLEALPDLNYLVDRVFPEDSLLCVYGAPGCGKSFLTVDLACCIATGLKWLGRDVARGSVLYVAAEGGRGYRKRVLAWKDARMLVGTSIPVFFILEPANLHAGNDVDHILAAAESLPFPPSLVVFDTLHRSMTGGDENSAQDVGLVMDRAARIKRELQCSVLFNHHTRKDGDAERGSFAIRGSVDTLAQVRETEDGEWRELACEKQKDFDPFDPLKFDLRPRSDSCVVRTYDPAIEAKGLTPRQRDALRSLSGFGKGATTQEWMKVAGIPDRTFYLVRGALVSQGLVTELEKGNSVRYSVTESGRFALASESR